MSRVVADIIELIGLGPDVDDDGMCICRMCRLPMSIVEPGLEPTALCNLCAQDAIEMLARHLAKIAADRAERLRRPLTTYRT